MKNSLLLFIFFVSMACSSKIGDSYYHEFYKDRTNKLIGLVNGDRVPLTSNELNQISYYPYDKSYRVQAKFEKNEKKELIEMPTYSGQTKEFIDLGTLKFKIDGEPCSLHVYQNVKLLAHPIYKKYYFIPFRDLTTGEETYGGGRYIDMQKSDFDQHKVLLDLNAAYNPWCAYSDGFNCPVPPAVNDLPVAIHAGEKNFKGEVQH